MESYWDKEKHKTVWYYAYREYMCKTDGGLQEWFNLEDPPEEVLKYGGTSWRYNYNEPAKKKDDEGGDAFKISENEHAEMVMVHTNDSDPNMQDAEIKALEDRLAGLYEKRGARSETDGHRPARTAPDMSSAMETGP